MESLNPPNTADFTIKSESGGWSRQKEHNPNLINIDLDKIHDLITY